MGKRTDKEINVRELYDIHMGPPFKPVNVPLDGIAFLWSINHTTQFDVICKLLEGALSPTAYVPHRDVEYYWSQYRLLRDTSLVCSSRGH